MTDELTARRQRHDLRWAVVGDCPPQRAQDVFSLMPEAVEFRDLPVTLPPGWSGVVLSIDHWIVPVEASQPMLADALLCELLRLMDSVAPSRALLLSPPVSWLDRSGIRVTLLEPAQHLVFALPFPAMPLIERTAQAEDPWWPGLLRLTAAGTVEARASRALPPAAARLPLLAPARPPASRAWLLDFLQELDLVSLLPRDASPVDETAARAGLLIWHDFLDEGHVHAQTIEGAEPGWGDHWHAVMHRREPDPANARYWFRRVRRPDWFASFGQSVQPLLASCPDVGLRSRLAALNPAGRWNPLAFVDFCEAVRDEEQPDGRLARQLQRAEMQRLLLDSLTHSGEP